MKTETPDPKPEVPTPLLPCPFCGGTANCDGDRVAPRVTCDTRGCAMYNWAVTPEKWNRRATHADLDAIFGTDEAMRAAIKSATGEKA